MDTQTIQKITKTNATKPAALLGANRRCVYYKDELCCAPRLRFTVCRSCTRINPRTAIFSLFNLIVGAARKMFNLARPRG